MNIKILLLILSCYTLTVQAQHDDFGQDALINPSATTFKFNIAPGPIKPTDASIAAHYQCPEWFRDAKFGIYMHWGINSITADGCTGIRNQTPHYANIPYWVTEHMRLRYTNII